LLDPERFPQYRKVAQSLRQLRSGFFVVSGHDCHLLKWINQVDRVHQLKPFLISEPGMNS